MQGVPAPAAPPKADTTSSSSMQARKSARLMERRFMRQAATAAHAQVIAGKLASQRGSTPDVRTLGKQLMKRGHESEQRLALLSLSTQVPLPSRASRKDRAVITRLRSLQGEEFDRVFLQHFGVGLQERELSVHQSLLASSSREPGLRALARQTVPVLARQLAAARQLLQEETEPLAARPAPAESTAQDASADQQQERRPGVAQRGAAWDADERDATAGITQAADVLRRMKDYSRVDALLRKARGVLLFPQYQRGGLLFGVRSGRGVLVTRDESGFSAPAFYRMEGGSIGLQAGADTGALAYLLMTEAAVQQFRSVRQISFDVLAGVTLGWDSERSQSSTGKVRDVIVWSGTRGAYAGAAVGVTQIVPDDDANRAFYGRDVSSSDILGGEVRNPHRKILGRLLGS